MKKSLIFVFVVLSICFVSAKVELDKWADISAEDLAATDNPYEKGGKAMYLFRHAEVINGMYAEHGAIKIFNEAGRDLANFSVPDNVRKIRARTVRPDGSFIEITKDDIMKKLVAKKKRNKKNVKVFTLPDAVVGSVLEYMYSAPLESYPFLYYGWSFQEDIYCKEAWAEFSSEILRSYNRFVIDTYHQARVRLDEDGGRARYSAFFVPAIPDEDFAPPSMETSAFLFMIYAFQQIKGANSLNLSTDEGKAKLIDLFWQQYGEDTGKSLYNFLRSKDKVRLLKDTILAQDTRTVDPAQKIYDYVVRNFRNTSYLTKGEEERNAAKQSKGQKEKANKSVDDVIKNGYGDKADLMMLCVALLRSAGLDACPAYVCGRDSSYFRKELLLDQLDEPLVAIKSASGWSYLDPGTNYCPYGEISWLKQDADGMIFHDKSGEFILTAIQPFEHNRIERKLDVTFDGKTAVGKLELRYKGNPDFIMKNEWDDESEEERRTFVKEYLEKNFPKADLTKYEFQNLRSREEPLVITAEFTVPEFVVETRTRLMFKPSMLGKTQNMSLTQASRKFPVCFGYANQVVDKITFHLDDGLICEQIPIPVGFENPVGKFTLQCNQVGSTFTCDRMFERKGVYYEVNEYPVVRTLFEVARQGDDVTVVLKKKE